MEFIKACQIENDRIKKLMKYLYKNILILFILGMLLGIGSCNKKDVVDSYFPLPEKDLKIVHSEAQSFMVDTVVSGLNRPWSMVFLPNKTVLITERGGNLLLVKNGQVQKDPISGHVPKGLRDIKLHPQYQENGWIYISYYIDPTNTDGGYTVLMRGKLEGNKLIQDKILYKAGPFEEDGEWYGSKIAFDNQNHVFFTVGIRGKRKNAQDKLNPSGKTMRLNDDGTIPSDNPFVHTKDALPEIYSYGHRMHEGLIRHPKTGEIWSTEFGELGGDEINIIKRGANYGWPEVTFSLEYNGSVISKDSVRKDVESPLHHLTIAPTDLAFLFSDRYKGWKDNLFIGSTGQRLLNRSVLKGNVVVHDEKLLKNIGRVRDVIMGPDKFLYILTEDTGLIVRLIPVDK